MAMSAPSSEVRAFRESFEALYKAIKDPGSLAVRLYSQDLISSMVRDETFALSLSYQERTSVLLGAVEQRIKYEPKSFHQFVHALEVDPTLKSVASILVKKYVELGGSFEDESSSKVGCSSQEATEKDQRCEVNLTLKRLVSVLMKIEHRWFELGIRLDLPLSMLKAIEVSYRDHTRCLVELLECWLSNDPAASWRKLVGVLQEMSESHLAHRIYTEYVQEVQPELQTRIQSDSEAEGQQVKTRYEDFLSDEDFLHITEYLVDMEKTDIYNLGLVLGLSQRKMRAGMDAKTFLDDVISAWLRKEDQVIKRGEPSWTVLVSALKHRRVGQTEIARNIARDKALLL